MCLIVDALDKYDYTCRVQRRDGKFYKEETHTLLIYPHVVPNP